MKMNKGNKKNFLSSTENINTAIGRQKAFFFSLHKACERLESSAVCETLVIMAQMILKKESSAA